MFTKLCKCGQTFDTKSLTRCICTKCGTEKGRQWRNNNRERCNKNQQRRRKANPEHHKMLGEKCRAKLRCYLAQVVNRTKSMCGKRKSREFTITTDEIVVIWNQQNGKCALTNLSMEHYKNSLKSASIDRKDPAGGYTIDNIQLVCKWVNLGKNKATDLEFLTVIREYATSYQQT